MEYHKIQTVFLRDPATKYKTLLEGQWALPEFEYLASNDWVFTEKIDGTNIRVKWDVGSGQVRFDGKTDSAQIPSFLIAKLQDLFPVTKFASLYPETSMLLYGEGYGAKIQKGGVYIPDGVNFILFDVLIACYFLERHNVEDIADKLGIDVVPIVSWGTLFDAVGMVRDGFPSEVGHCIAEGLVMRPETELLSRRGKRIIAKVKYKDFIR